MRYFVHIGFTGLQYRGWQRQNGVNTVQGTVESCIGRIFRKHIPCIGCGRTDTKVHAAQFFFHFDMEQNWNFDLIKRFNKVLPDDIAVFDIIPVESNQHAQFSVIERTYEYYVHTVKNPFLHGYSTYYELKNMALDKMRRAADIIRGCSDFSQSCRTANRNDSNICKVQSLKIFTHSNGNRLKIRITADRFVRGMVRIIAKRILDIGNGTLTLDELSGYLSNDLKPKSIPAAYPQGLYLVNVKYPFLELPVMAGFNMLSHNQSDCWIEL